MNENIINSLSFEEELTNYARVIKALSINYLNVFTVKPEANRGKIIKLNGYITEGMINSGNDFDYMEMLKAYANKRVYKDDIALFLDNLNARKIIEEFANDTEQIEFSYRVIDRNEIHFYSAHYIRISQKGEPLRLVAGFRNIDNIVSSKEKEHYDGMAKAYASLANVYYSMHRINLVNGTFSEIKASPAIHQFQIPDSNDYKTNINVILRNVVDTPFLDQTLRFCALETLEERLKGKKFISFEFVGRFSGWVRATFIREDESKDGKLIHVLFAIQVIDESKQRENELRILAETDQLTGLLNRGTGERKIKEAVKSKEKGIFLLMDVDHFKTINDTFGHESGDIVIREISNCLKEASDGHKAILMRLGGDEFAIFAYGITEKAKIIGLWEKIVISFQNMSLGDEKKKKITLSAGCAIYDGEENEDFNSLYKKADNALYVSKKTNGFKFTFDD